MTTDLQGRITSDMAAAQAGLAVVVAGSVVGPMRTAKLGTRFSLVNATN